MLSLLAAMIVLSGPITVSMEFTNPQPVTFYAGRENNVLKIKITNHATSKIDYWISGFWPNHKWVVYDLKGNREPYSKLGIQHSKAFHAGSDKSYPVAIAPGKSYIESVPDPITDFELKPGKYKLILSYDDINSNQTLKIESSELRFVLKP